MKKNILSLFILIGAIISFGPMQSAKAIAIDLGGTSYDVITIDPLIWTTPFDDAASIAATALVKSQPWYGSAPLAQEAAGKYFTAGGATAAFIYNMVIPNPVQFDIYSSDSASPSPFLAGGHLSRIELSPVAIVRPASAPDGGQTVLLLGVGLLGLVGMRRRFAK